MARFPSYDPKLSPDTGHIVQIAMLYLAVDNHPKVMEWKAMHPKNYPKK